MQRYTVAETLKWRQSHWLTNHADDSCDVDISREILVRQGTNKALPARQSATEAVAHGHSENLMHDYWAKLQVTLDSCACIISRRLDSSAARYLSAPTSSA